MTLANHSDSFAVALKNAPGSARATSAFIGVFIFFYIVKFSYSELSKDKSLIKKGTKDTSSAHATDSVPNHSSKTQLSIGKYTDQKCINPDDECIISKESVECKPISTSRDRCDCKNITVPHHVKPVLQSIRNRRSVFPAEYVDREISKDVVQSMLNAAMWAPFHGTRPPWRFIVLGKKAMVEMQELSLRYYDNYWGIVGWPGSKKTKGTREDYLKWRNMTEEEITGRWGPCSYMIANVSRRQAGSKIVPEWEETAATACAVQNMHIQASSFPGVACYWSSWHDAARDSKEMRDFLKIDAEDKVLGFFIVSACHPSSKDRRKRTLTPECVDWRID